MIQHDTRHQTHDTDLQPSRSFSTLAMLTTVAQVFLLASAWLLPAVSNFSLIGDNISELVLGDFGLIQTIAFFLAGISTVGLAYTIRQLTLGVRGSWVGSLLVGLNGVGLVLASIFPTDRIDTPADVWAQSTTGTIHSITALISYLAIIIAMFVLTWTFARDARWLPITVFSGFLFSGALTLFFAQGEGPRIGLMQRLLVSFLSAWLIMVAFQVRALTTSGTETNR